MSKPDLATVARRWLQAGFSVIPVSDDKRAYQSWGDNQIRPYALDEVERVFKDPRAKKLAIVCGYGGVMCFDFDPDKKSIAAEPVDLEGDFWTPWSDTAESLGVEPATQRTPSGGIHAIVVAPTPVGNEKLARVPAKPDEKGRARTHTTIETRGKGGYFVLYDHDLNPASLPSITEEQFQALLETAVALDRTPDEPEAQEAARAARGTGAKANATRKGLVGWFNERYTVQEVLLRNGYRQVHNKFLAPSSTSGNAGVVIFKDDHGLELCYSHHSDVLGDGHAHDAFDTFKLLEFHGSFEAAMGEVRRLRDQERFTFSGPRAREDKLSLTPNRGNAVQDATTIWGHPLTPNTQMTPKEGDLGSNAPETDTKSTDPSNPVQDDTSRIRLKPRSDLGSNGDTKGQAPSPSRKPDLGSNAGGVHARAHTEGIKRWGERDRPPPVQWAVHHLIQDNAENLIAGEPGVGKSWISGDLAVAVATGSAFLDRHTQQGPVVIINFDDPSESLPRMFAERSARGREYDFAELPIYYWQPEESKPYPPEGLITPDVFEYLLEQVALIKPRLIIVDAYSSAFPNLDGNKGNDVIRAFEALRQLRIAAGKPCSSVLIDHTPKATLQDSKRRGVSGSQQKHAKTRTVHIIRHVDPGEVNGDDVLEWEVFKANAAPRQEPFGVNREMDSLLNTAKLTTRPLPERGSGAKYDRAAKAAITYLASRAGETVTRQELLSEIVAMANVSMATARRGLRSNEFVDHPQIRLVEMGGRGNPQGFMYEPEPVEMRVSLYEQFRAVIFHPTAKHPHLKTIRDAFQLSEEGDDDAKDRIDQYLARDDVRDWVTRNYALIQEGGQ